MEQEFNIDEFEEEEKKNRLGTIILILILIIITIICVIFYIKYYMIQDYDNFDKINNSEESEEIGITEESIVEDCKDKKLKATANCLAKNIKKIYKFTSTDDDIAKNMTFEEIKEVGTDCTGWAYLYLRLAKKLEYDASTIRIDSDGKAHRTMIINNKEGFCVINFKHVECFMNKR